jgi:hypothetical protein
MATSKTTKKTTPRKARTYVKEKVIPVVKSDVQKVLGLPQWMQYAILGVLVLVVLKLFVIEGCDSRGVDANTEKVERLESELKASEERIQEVQDSLLILDRILDDLYVLSNKTTDDRKRTETDGNTQRNKAKIITDEVKAKISDPRTTDSERDVIERELLRAREAAKVSYDQ